MAISSLTAWLRLEPQCRTEDWSESLKARIHDPLWMLGRQWQIGERRGTDGGSPVIAEVSVHSGLVDQCRRAGDAPDRDEVPIELPLEPHVEAIPPDVGADYLLRTRLGLAFERGLPLALRDDLRHRMPLRAPDDAPVAARALLDAVGSVVDVLQLGPQIAEQPAETRPVLAARLEAIAGWLRAYAPAPSKTAWVAEESTYRFEAAAGAQTLVASDYHDGEPDWFTFDAMAPRTPPDNTRSTWCIPCAVRFAGMPHERWWYMEDSNVDLGAIRPELVDVGRLAALSFATCASNDWFVVPISVDRNSLTAIASLTVFDSFGRSQDYESSDIAYPALTLFAPSRHTDREALANLLYCPAGAALRIEGPPLEEIELARDEALNIVLAIVRRSPDGTGGSVDGSEPGREHEVAARAPRDDRRTFVLERTAPRNWFPFVPVIEGGGVRLQRHVFRHEENGALVRFAPAGRIISARAPFYLKNASIPRTGLRVVETAQLMRTSDGKVVFWFGRKRLLGLGEASSGMEFDSIE